MSTTPNRFLTVESYSFTRVAFFYAKIVGQMCLKTNPSGKEFWDTNSVDRVKLEQKERWSRVNRSKKKRKAKGCGFILLFFLVTFLSWTSQTNVALTTEPLRIYCQKRVHWNPLDTFDPSGKALFSLVYRGLFTIDSSERLQYDLLQSALWSPDHRNLTLQMKDQLVFPNGTQLRARDVAVSILAYRAFLRWAVANDNAFQQPVLDPEEWKQISLDEIDSFIATSPGQTTSELGTSTAEEESPAPIEMGYSRREQINDLANRRSDPTGLDTLDAIESIEILSDKRLTLNLTRHCDELPWQLIFPILSASDALSHPLEPVEGISQFYLTSKRQDEAVQNLQILYRPEGSSENRILCNVLQIEDEREALKAFNRGDLDLLLLKPETYRLQANRREVKSIPIETQTIRCLVLRNNASGKLSDSDLGTAFREAIKTWPIQSALGSALRLPYHRRDWRTSELPADTWDQSSIQSSLATVREKLKEQSLTLLYQSLPENREWLDSFSKQMDGYEAVIQGKPIRPSEYEEALKKESYDMALVSVPLSLPLRLSTLGNELRDRVPSIAFHYPDQTQDKMLSPLSFDQFDLTKDTFQTINLRFTLKEWSEALKQSGLYLVDFEKQGLLYSWRAHRLNESSYWYPYRGLEKWIQ